MKSSYSLYAQCVFAAAATGAMLLSTIPSAVAQPAGYGDYYQSNGEEIQVIAPRHMERSSIGAPIENVSLSRPVRIDDLDLRTHWGVRTLRTHISTTAHALCRQMDAMYVPVSDDPPCYQTAVRAAWRQARAAIDDAHYAD